MGCYVTHGALLRAIPNASETTFTCFAESAIKCLASIEDFFTTMYTLGLIPVQKIAQTQSRVQWIAVNKISD